MSLTVGSRHGPYDVLALIGFGTMGPTFRARDTSRGRDVVIEVLPARTASDTSSLARVQRVAASLAALDHPNVAKSYGLGSALDPVVLVSELVEGPSLAELISTRGTPSPSDSHGETLPRFGLDAVAALPIAYQIACALETAHGHDLVHGGLRPAAITIPPDGVLKVRGFGFEVTSTPESADDGDELGPLAVSGIEAIAYTSPEQLKGRPADRQSDIWSFGVVLYEMLAGVRPFLGEDVAETLAVVLRADPQWSALPIDTPMAVRTLLRRCLDRDLASRLDDMAFARQQLEEHLNRQVAAVLSEPESPDAEAIPDAKPEASRPGGTIHARVADDSAVDDPTVDETPAVTRSEEVVDEPPAQVVEPVSEASSDEPSVASETPSVAETALFASFGPPAATPTPSPAPAPAPTPTDTTTRPSGTTSGVASRRRPVGSVVPAMAALLVGAIGAGFAVWTVRGPASAAPTSRYILSAAPSAPLAVTDESSQDLAISPDGTFVAYATDRDGRRHVYVRHIDELEGRALTEVPSPETLFFSSDGHWIGFADGVKAWQKVPVGGGPPVELNEQRGPSRGASWGPAENIVFAEAGSGLFRVSASGGLRRVLTTPNREVGEVGHYWPHVLPGGRTVLFTIVSGPDESRTAIAALDLESRQITRLVPSGRHPQFVTSGHLVYSAGGSLYAVRFDPDEVQVEGHPVPLVSNVVTKTSGTADFQVSPSGTLVYASGRLRGPRPRILTWVRPDGTEEPLPAEPRGYGAVRIAPGGRRIAVEIREPESEIWIWDLEREVLSPLLSAPAGETNPVWTPDGRRIAFQSNQSPRGLFWAGTDGAASAESLHASDLAALPFSWSRDGERLVYGVGPVATGGSPTLDLNVAGTAGTGTGSIEPLIATEFDERNAEISPDGRWIVHESAESGRPEIYVRPFPDASANRWQISTEGGRQPVWDPSGDRIFYLSPAGAMMAVDVDTTAEFEAGTPRTLFDGRFETGPGRSFDIDPEADRFLMIKEVDAIPPPRFDVVIVEGWAQELTARVP